jgi:Domain of unknown function (DUF6378)/Domain of unknown function (DUF4406)
MTTYYISGPMRGKPDYNFPLFHEVEEALWSWIYNQPVVGSEYRILNPANDFNGDPSRPVTEYMKVDLEQVLSADVIVLLPGWRESEGAGREISVAQWSGKRFMEAIPYSVDRSCWHFLDVTLLTEGGKPSSVRGDALDEAKALITGDRNNAYGPPWQDFSRTAGALNAYGYRGPDGRPLESHDIAVMVMAVKLSRLMWTPTKRDSWVDIAGYAGCGLECALHDEETRRKA